MNREIGPRIAVVVALALAASIHLQEWSFPFSQWIVVGVLLTVPGFVVTRLAGIREPIVTVLLLVPVSLAVNGLVATAAIYLGVWSTELILLVVIAITLVASALSSNRRSSRGVLLSLALLPGLVLIAAAASTAAPS